MVGYRVYYGTSSRNFAQALGGGSYVTTTNFTSPNLPAGNTYFFAVTAIDGAGQESAYSDEVSKAIP